jgi:prevent-host-death family protein
MIETITATEANRRFSELLREVGAGKSFIVTSHGRPVMRLVPDKGPTLAEREAARKVLFERLRNQTPTKIEPWTRAELYED